MNAWNFQFMFQLHDSSNVINGARLVPESEFLFLLLSSLVSIQVVPHISPEPATHTHVSTQHTHTHKRSVHSCTAKWAH